MKTSYTTNTVTWFPTFAEVVKLLKEISCSKSITHIFVRFVRSQNTNPLYINTSPVPVRSQRVGLTRIPLTTTAILSRARKRGSDYFMGLSLTIFRRLTVLYHVLSIMNDYKIVGGQTWYKNIWTQCSCSSSCSP